MSYSRKAKYTHHRRINPDELYNMKTVEYPKFPHRVKYPSGTKAICGQDKITNVWRTQSILIPKKKKR